MSVASDQLVRTDQPISTWFGIGGSADNLAAPEDEPQLLELLERFAGEPVRILGDGANLLVDDDGIDGLTISLERFDAIQEQESEDGRVSLRVGAGASLPKLITRCVRNGLAGIETLAGIPASVGGAVRMNAGGAFGQIADVITSVDTIDSGGRRETIPRAGIPFAYRRSGLEDRIIVGAELELRRVDPGQQPALREKLKDVMAYKKGSQPLADNSAGCCFKNPTIDGQRVSAGMLIDRAGAKGLSVGGATVSDVHANFISTSKSCTAGDVIELMRRVTRIVQDADGVTLEPEVVIWSRHTEEAP